MRLLLALALLLVPAYAQKNAVRQAGYLSALDERAPQIIHGGEWTTRLVFTNLRSVPVTFPVRFYAGDGRPASVPIVGRSAAATQSVTIPGRGQVQLETPYDTSRPGQTGWAEIDVPCTGAGEDNCGGVAGLAVLRNRASGRPDFEAAFPFRYGEDRLILPVDNANGYSTVLMIVNGSSFSSVQVTAEFRDAAGVRVGIEDFTLGARATLVEDLAGKWSAAAGLRGTVEFRTNRAELMVTALRINPSNSFTPVEPFNPL